MVHLISLCITGGLISPPQSCHNSPSFSLTSLSTSSFPSLTPALLSANPDSSVGSPLGPSLSRPDSADPDSADPKLSQSIQQSGHPVDEREQNVLTDLADGCQGSSNHAASVASLLSPSLSTSESPERKLSDCKQQSEHAVDQREETVFTAPEGDSLGSPNHEASLASALASSSLESPDTELPPLTEHTGHEVEEGEQDVGSAEARGCQSSGDSNIMARSRRSSVTMLSSVPHSAEDEDDDPMDSVDQKSRADLSEEEQEGDGEDDDESERMDVDADSSVQQAAFQPRRSLRNANNPRPESLHSSDHSASKAMDVDADSDSSVKQVAPLQPWRSLRNAPIENKPSPEWVAAPPVIKCKRQLTRKMVLLDVCVQNS